MLVSSGSGLLKLSFAFVNSPPQPHTDLSTDNEENRVHENDQLLWISVDQQPLSFACADKMDITEGEERAEPTELEASCMPRWPFSLICTHQCHHSSWSFFSFVATVILFLMCTV